MLSTKTMIIAGAGLPAAAGLALAGASLAGAESVPTATNPGYGYGSGHGGGARGEGGAGATNGNTDPTKAMGSDETLLTGDTAARVTAAAQAKEPGATIERVETDSDGVYEAHLFRADGTHVIVQGGADFAVTNVQAHAGGRGGGPGGGKGRGTGGQPPVGGTAGGQTPSASGSATAG